MTETIYTYIIEKFYAKKPIPFYLLDPSKIHKPQKEHKRLKINNPSVLSKLNKIQHAIINPDIFCEENPAELRGLLIDQIIYSTLRYSEENEAPLLISNRNSFNVDEIKPFFQSEIKRDIDKSPNNNNTLFLSDFSVNQSFNRIPYSFNENDIGSFLIDEETSYRQMEIFKALALCHSTKSKATRDGNIEFCYLSQDEQRAIEYARLRDFSFEGVSYSKVNSDYRCYTLKIKDKKIHFPILSINRLEEKQSSFSIVVQDVESEEKDESNSSTFYIKSNDISILNKFDLEADQMIAINDLLKKAKFDGLRFIIYGRKKMDKFQTLEYIQKVNILKSRLANHNNENDIFFQKLESDLYLITIAFFHDKIKENSKVLIKNLKEAQIPIWILTNQSETNAIALAYKTKILEKEWEIYDFKIDSINSGLITLSDFLLKIRNKIVTKSINNKIPYLTILSKNFEAISGKNDQNNEQSDKWKAFILLINGESLVIIKKDFHLLEHFKFLLSFCKGFLAYDMSQSHRRIFLQILKEVNSGNIIMSVGSNYADFPLLYESNIGVLIKKENSIVETEERLLVDEGDLIVEDIEMLSDLIFARSRTIDEKLDVILNFIFFCSFLYSNHILMFLANSNFLTFFYYEPSEGILKDGFITICPLLLYLLNSEDKNALILQNIPIFYNEKNFISIKKLFRDFALKIVLRSLIESMLIYFMFTGNLIMDRGVLNSYKLCIVEVFYANGLFVYMHFFNKIEETNLIESHTFWLIQFAFYGYFLLAILQLMEENLFKETIVTKFLEALRFPEYGFISTFFVLSLFGMNHLYELYVFPYLDSTLYDKFLQKFKEGMKFKAIVKELTPKVLYQNALIEITEKAKNFFTKIRMDSILQECKFSF